jgi:hypothetical protein
MTSTQQEPCHASANNRDRLLPVTAASVWPSSLSVNYIVTDHLEHLKATIVIENLHKFL